MHSRYTGVKRELTQDELGGLWFLYPVIDGTTGDLTGDSLVDHRDLGTMLAYFERNVPVADVNFDGFVDSSDLGILLASYNVADIGLAPDNAPPERIPLPASALMLLLGLPAATRRR